MGWRSAILAVTLTTVALPGAACAQDAEAPAAEGPAPDEAPALTDAQIAERLMAGQFRTHSEKVQRQCARRTGTEIVVCVDRGEDLRVPSTAESDPDSLEARRARNGGVPLAPQLDRGSCKGKPGCIVGGWAPPPIFLIDLKAIPEAPAGSDADKVAKGEMPDR